MYIVVISLRTSSLKRLYKSKKFKAMHLFILLGELKRCDIYEAPMPVICKSISQTSDLAYFHFIV